MALACVELFNIKMAGLLKLLTQKHEAGPFYRRPLNQREGCCLDTCDRCWKGWVRGMRCWKRSSPHVHLIGLWQLLVSLRAPRVVYKIFRGQLTAWLGWAASPDSTLNPEAIPGPLETPSGFSSGQKACKLLWSWEPDPGQMDMEAKQEATTVRGFERHLSPLLADNMACCVDGLQSLISPTATHARTHTHIRILLAGMI